MASSTEAITLGDRDLKGCWTKNGPFPRYDGPPGMTCLIISTYGSLLPVYTPFFFRIFSASSSGVDTVCDHDAGTRLLRYEQCRELPRVLDCV